MSSQPLRVPLLQFLPIYISLVLSQLGHVVWILRSSVIVSAVYYDGWLLFSHLVQLLLQVMWQVNWVPLPSGVILPVATSHLNELGLSDQGCGGLVHLVAERGGIHLANNQLRSRRSVYTVISVLWECRRFLFTFKLSHHFLWDSFIHDVQRRKKSLRFRFVGEYLPRMDVVLETTLLICIFVLGVPYILARNMVADWILFF